MATVHLVDASPYIFRAYHSLPVSLKSPEGQPINAVHGFLGFLLKLAQGERPTHLAVTFDRDLVGSFRNEFYPSYKQQREKPPAELEAQIDLCLEAAEIFGAACFIDDRYEADDLIATLARPLLGEGHRAVIVTSDKDLAQLVSDAVELFDFARGERYGPAQVKEKFGVGPEQITDLLGLAGDPVDNIPGVPGIGRKTAAEILSLFPTVEELYDRLEEIPNTRLRGARSLCDKLAAHREPALLSKLLATVATNAPVRATLSDLAWAGPDLERTAAFCERLGIKSFPSRLARPEA